MTEAPPAVFRLVQPALLSADLARSIDRMHALFGMAPSHIWDAPGRLVAGGTATTRIAGYAVAPNSHLEIVHPMIPGGAGRDGLRGANLDIPLRSEEYIRGWLAAGGFDISNHMSPRPDVPSGVFTLNERDTGGALLWLHPRAPGDDYRRYVGADWRVYALFNTRVIHRALGMSIAAHDARPVIEKFARLGMRYVLHDADAGEQVAQADLADDSFLQVRAPLADNSELARFLGTHAPGLFHVCLGTNDLHQTRARIEAADAVVTRETSTPRAFWTDHVTTLGVAREIRAI